MTRNCGGGLRRMGLPGRWRCGAGLWWRLLKGSPMLLLPGELTVNRNTATLWRKRFCEEGLDGLWDIAPGRGRKPLYGTDKVAAIVEATLQTKPAGMTHWSCRTMAQNQGVVSRSWARFRLPVRLLRRRQGRSVQARAHGPQTDIAARTNWLRGYRHANRPANRRAAEGNGRSARKVRAWGGAGRSPCRSVTSRAFAVATGSPRSR